MTDNTLITVVTESDAVYLISPFNAELPTQAKAIGGRWDPARKAWVFDPRDSDRVRDLARSVYGTDGTEDPDDTVTVRVRTAGWANNESIVVAGRTVAERRYRDGTVQLAAGVIVVEGAFAGSGGSRNNPTIGRGDAILELRDFPRAAAVMAAEADSDITIVDDAGPSTETLRAERDRLLARIAEIDALLEDA